MYTFRVSLDFWSLESGDPEILESPGFGKFQHVGYFSQSVCVKDFDFQCRIRKVHHSRNLRGIIWNSGISLEMTSFFKQYQGLEYFSHSNFSLEFDYECSIQKFHHKWNFPGIIWNSWFFLDVAYFLPNLKLWVSIQPSLIILYAFGLSFDFWSLESGHPEIHESLKFCLLWQFSMFRVFLHLVCVKGLDFNAEIQSSITP